MRNLAENLSLIETSAAAAPTPDELDQLMADISASGYASEAVEVVERWTRAKWGVESAFTTRLVAERAAERERGKPRFGHPEAAR